MSEEKNSTSVHLNNSENVGAQFADPPAEFSNGPFWVWNDLVTDEHIRSTLADLSEQGIRQVVLHPRPGLMTPYLSDEWFRLWKVALREAERLGMFVWIYDENSYPSGFAGGFVAEAMPESRGQGLYFCEVSRPDEVEGDVFAVFCLTDDGSENVTEAFQNGTSLDHGKYIVASRQFAERRSWHAGKYYVDLLMPGVTEKFIEITFEAYKREIGAHFGKRVLGIFSDEPHLCPAEFSDRPEMDLVEQIHWSDHLPQEFEQRWGYNLVEHLPSLVRRVGDWQRVRHNYYQLLLELFIDRWSKPCHAFCEENHLEFTGHYWEHGWPDASHGPDNMAMYAWHQRPAIDNLMNEYSESVDAQFGNSRMGRELASVANQLGRRRTLCETYGAGGWDLRMEDMKRIGDWLFATGVNTLVEHLSFVSIRGSRKRDHPQSFSYHEPWWEAYHENSQYFTRLSLALSSGKQVNGVLLIQPTTTAWIYQPELASRPQLDAIGQSFQELINQLEQQQVEYDIGCENIIADHGRNDGAQFVVGQRAYDLVVLPPHTEQLNSSTMKLIEAYVAAGGKVICCGEAPTRVDGAAADWMDRISAEPGWLKLQIDDAIRQMRERSEDGLCFHRTDGDQGLLFHHRRRLDDGELLLLVNTSIKDPSSGSVTSQAKSAHQWDLETGASTPYVFSKADSGTDRSATEGIRFDYELPPCGSLLLFLSNTEGPSRPVVSTESRTIEPQNGTAIRRLEPNVLVLDYVDITAGGTSIPGSYFFPAQHFVFQQNGMDGNPWSKAVQFRDEIISTTFPSDSHFSATYRFNIEQQVPASLAIVLERCDLYSITCNDRSIEANQEDWWLDRSFGKVDLSATAQVGENEVTITAEPMTVFHELEPAYLLGDFSLTPTQQGFNIIPPQAIQRTEGWNAQGLPFYAEGVAYSQRFDIGEPNASYAVSLGKWLGSVAKVLVNGHMAGYIRCAPWQCDVTRWIQPGENEVEVVVIGTLRNTLGPHHAGPITGKAWPHIFHEGPETGPPPGENYSTLAYGLLEPFTLIENQ